MPAASLSSEEVRLREVLKSYGADEDKERRQADRFVADIQSTDPAVHRKLLDQQVSSLRYGNPGLAEALGLTADQEQELLEKLAEAELRATKESFGWTHIKGAEESIPAWLAEQRRQRLELLGEDQLARYESYLKTIPERSQVMELRSQLDAHNALSSEQEAQLIAAVYEERERYIASSLRQPGARDTFPAGPVYVQSSYEPGSPLDMQFREQQLKRSEAFVRRLHDRAAKILNAEQLRRFDDLHGRRLTAEQINMERFRDDPQ